MKLKSAVIASLAAAALLLTGCGGSSSSSSSAPSSVAPVESSSAPASSSVVSTPALGPIIYRGRVEAIADDGSLTVSQMDGFDYGSPTIIFHVTDQTALTPDGAEIAVDSFIEVEYGGMLAQSLPPQGTADKINVVSSMSEGIIVNCTIQEVTKQDGNISIQLLPFGAEDSSLSGLENMIILNVPENALFNITEEELVAGAEVSAVTSGIAAMSMPPQMPVVALLPYQPAMAAE